MASPSEGGRSWVKFVVIAVAMIVVGSGATYAFGYFGTKGSLDATRDATHHAESAVPSPGSADLSASSNAAGPVDISAIDPETYPNQSLIALANKYPGIQIDIMKPFIDKHIEKALNDYLADISAVNGYPMESGLPGDTSPEALIGNGTASDNAQQRVNRGGLLSYMSFNTDKYSHDGQRNIDLGKNIALYQYDTSSYSYELEINYIDKGQKRVPTTLVASDSINLPPNGSFAGHAANGLPTMVARVGGDVESNLNSEFVWQTRNAHNDPSVKSNVFLGSVRADQTEFVVTNLNQWLAQQNW